MAAVAYNVAAEESMHVILSQVAMVTIAINPEVAVRVKDWCSHRNITHGIIEAFPVSCDLVMEWVRPP